MILIQRIDTKFTEIGHSKEKLLALGFSSQIQILFSFRWVSSVVEMSLLQVKFYSWYHRLLGYKKYQRYLTLGEGVMQFLPSP